MRRILTVVLAAPIISAMVAWPIDARADGGQVAAGFLGGLAFGAIISSAAAPRYYGSSYYYAPPPVYVAPAPVYGPSPCYWTRGEQFWDGYRWVRPRVQVCD
jgi:hypothetical protein